MISITIPKGEIYDEKSEEFVYFKGATISLEHSLISISKWESKWHKPFLSHDNKTAEETIDYIKCMTITQNVDPRAYEFLTPDNINQVNRYIEDPMTATTFSDTGRPSREIITSEIIYYWMIAMNIPSEYQKWHLNRLLTLIQVCSIKNSPKKKMSSAELNARNRALNEARKKQWNTRG